MGWNFASGRIRDGPFRCPRKEVLDYPPQSHGRFVFQIMMQGRESTNIKVSPSPGKKSEFLEMALTGIGRTRAPNAGTVQRGALEGCL